MDSPTILVVDDDVQVRNWMRITLEAEGYRVLEAGNGNEALVQYALHQPDLIVMDLYMPDKDGFETISLMRRDGLTTKILAVSGNFHKNHDMGAMAKALGAKGILSKPFIGMELLDGVKALLKAG